MGASMVLINISMVLITVKEKKREVGKEVGTVERVM